MTLLVREFWKLVREKSVKSQGILLSIVCGNPVNERSIEIPKTTPKLDSTTANHHKTSYHMRGSRKFSLWVGRADGSTKFTITKIVWQIEGGLNPLSSPLWNHPCIVFMGCYDIMPVRKEVGKSYWKIPFCDDDATREK